MASSVGDLKLKLIVYEFNSSSYYNLAVPSTCSAHCVMSLPLIILLAAARAIMFSLGEVC